MAQTLFDHPAETVARTLIGAELEVGMGPIVVDDNAWYLVRDARPEPAFEEGWIADDFPTAGHTERLAALLSPPRG